MSSVAQRELGTLAPLVLALPLGLLALGVLRGESQDLAFLILLGLAGLGFAYFSVRRPFVPLLLLATLTQHVGLTGALFGSRSLISYTDALVLLIVVGIVLGKRLPHRPGRGVPEDVALRLAVLLVVVMVLSVLKVPSTMSLYHTRFEWGLIETQKFVGYFALVFLTQLLAVDARKVRALILAVAIGSGISAGVVASDAFLGTKISSIGKSRQNTRLSGTHENAGEGAKMMGAGVALAAMLFVRDRRLRWLTGGILLAGAVGIPSTGTRAALVVLAFGALWLLWKHRRHRRIGAIILVAPIVASLAFTLVPPETIERFASLKNLAEDSTTQERIAMYEVGWDMVKKHPLLGVGPAQFSHTWTTDFEYRWYPSKPRLPFHNAFGGMLVDYGLVGLALFAGMMWTVFRGLSWTYHHAADPEHRMLAEVLQFGFGLYFLGAMTGPDHRSMFFWFLPAISLALVRVARLDTLEDRRRRGLLEPGLDPWRPLPDDDRRVAGDRRAGGRSA